MRVPTVRSLTARPPLILGLILSLTLTVRPANATTIPASAALGGIPAAPGTGLSSVYDRLNQIPTTLSNAAQEAAGLSTPTATSTAETICFPTCAATMQDGTSLATYIATNGTNLSGSSVLGSAYATFIGALLIPTAGIYSFDLYSDDGASLTIGGQTLIDMENPQNWAGESASVHFAQAGLYTIDVNQFDIGGYTGITLTENYAAIPVADLYQTVPGTGTESADATVAEPGTLGLLLVGMIGTVVLARRRGGARVGVSGTR